MWSKTQIMAGLALCVALGGSTALEAQDAACPGGRTMGDLGVTAFYGAARDWSGGGELFRTEPKVRGVVDGGPADGVLEANDVVVAVDGLLITTEEGGRRLARIVPGQVVALTVRRGGEERKVTIRAGSKCDLRPAGPRRPAAAPRASVATPRASAPMPRTQSPQAAPAAPTGERRVQAVPRTGGAATPRAAAAPASSARRPSSPAPPSPQGPTVRFGFRLQCQDCNLVKGNGKDGSYWSFPQSPVVDQVEAGSPADQGGLRRGDRLTHIDGLALTSPQGGRRLAEVDAGETVEWTFLRGNERRTTKVVTGGNAWPHRSNWSQPQGAAAGAWPTRFSGNVGSARVEVQGAPVNVTEDRQNGEIVIRSQDVLVRVKVPKSDQQ